MSEQVGWRGWWRHLRDEAPYWAATLPRIPRLVHRALEDRPDGGRGQELLQRLIREQQRQTRLLVLACVILGAIFAGVAGLLIG
jgi:ubiquinone biosynthesis protein